MKSHPYDSLTMGWTGTMAIDVLKQTGERPQGLNPHKKLQAPKKCQESGKQYGCQEWEKSVLCRAHRLDTQCQEANLENIHLSNVMQTQ